MGNINAPITTEKALVGENANKIIEFEKRKQINKFSKETLSFLMDEEIEEAISILLEIKQERNEKKRIILEHEFYGLVKNAWYREMEGTANE